MKQTEEWDTDIVNDIIGDVKDEGMKELLMYLYGFKDIDDI